MTSKIPLIFFCTFTLIVLQDVLGNEQQIQPISNSANLSNSATVPPQNLGKRPSMWSRTVHHLRQSRRQPTPYRKLYLRRSTEMKPIVEPPVAPPVASSANDEESQFLQSGTFLNLKEFANQLVNETATLLKAAPQPRSYQTNEVGPEESASQQQQQQLWDDKDQAYHASSYTGLEYEPPTSYHHPFHHPPPPHYYQVPQKKDDSLFTKVALLALFKLILAKLKAIGFLKIILLFALKLPILFFKMLIVFKGFKFLKLLSIPFLIAAFALPLLPLIPFFIFTFLPFLLLIPLALPLLLPFLLFLPIVPVTTPTAAQGRRKRDISIPESVTANQTWSILDEEWKGDRKKNMFKTRTRPVSTARRSGTSRYEPFLNEEHTENLIELTQRVIQSQHCMERAACEFAAYNDSKIYQSAVMWALGKLQTYAPMSVQGRIDQYSKAYEKGMQRRSSDFCSERFQCNRPKVFLVQGQSTYNLI